jgi:hypothetical protein
MRKIKVNGNGPSPIIQYSGDTNSVWLPTKQIWTPQYQAEITSTIQMIFNQPIPTSLQNKRIASLDIETTTYIPAARKGHINHITQSILDCTQKQPTLMTFQIINMNRKPENVKFMLEKVWTEMGDVDIQLVFNAAFDILILKNQIQQYNLNLKFANTIVDLMRTHKNLASLEEWLNIQLGFQRSVTEKGNFEEYYTLFKKDKLLEPISSYNIMDTLTPLLAYLHHEEKNDWKKLI